jgi:hypothetical protein
MKLTGLLKEYSDKGLFRYSFSTNEHYYDVSWSTHFTGGKKERNKLIRHLNKLGFVHHHGWYKHREFFS